MVIHKEVALKVWDLIPAKSIAVMVKNKVKPKFKHRSKNIMRTIEK